MESTHPFETSVKLIKFFLWSRVSSALAHYSTKPLTTGPDFDPLVLLIALSGDEHPNPGPSKCPCLVCFKNVASIGTSFPCTKYSQCVHSRCSGLRNVVGYRIANGWICTTCGTPPQPRAPSSLHSRSHASTLSDNALNIFSGCQWHRQQTDGTQHLPGGAQHQSGGRSRIQAHGTIQKSQHLELHPSTT